jgi:hypothetical protein
MNSITRDPLLAIAKGILWFLMGVMVIAAIACLIAIPALLLNTDKVSVELAKEGVEVATGDFIGAVCLVLVLASVLMAILFQIFRLLKRIVDTVGEGDPFVPQNARRLTQMAWLTLAGQVVTLPIGAIAMWLGDETEGVREGDIHVDGGFDGNGLLLILILFILARVFRKGAEMRAELEGTV